MRQKGDTYSNVAPGSAGRGVALNTTLSQHTNEQFQIWQAICATQFDYVVIYDREGHIVQMSEYVCTLLGLDNTQDPLQLPPEHTIQFFLRDEQGHILPDEHWPVSRILHGEIIKQAEAVDAQIRRIDDHEVLVGVCGAPLYDVHNRISGAIVIVREASERRKMEYRMLGAVEALLAIEEALSKEPGARGGEAAYAVEQRLVALPRYLLNCQCSGLALVEPETLALHPIAMAGVSLEQERRWRHSSYGVCLQNYLGDSNFMARLLEGEVLLLDHPLPFLSELSNWGLVVPMHRRGTITGILLLGYSASKKPQLSNNELALVSTIAGLAACIGERERQRQAREQVQKAREDAEQEAQQVKRLLRSYLATLKREFRPVLTSIQSQSTLLHDHQLEVVEMQTRFAAISNDAQRLEYRINEMLEREETTPVMMPLDLCWLDLNALLVDIVNHFRPTAPRHCIYLHLARALPLLWGDQEKLSRAITNVVSNIIKSSPGGGEIYITSASEGTIVHVSIRDQGAGTSAQELERRLERYNSEAGSLSRRGKAEASGLSFVCSTIHMHGGQVWVEHVPDKGSIIHLTLPFTDIL